MLLLLCNRESSPELVTQVYKISGRLGGLLVSALDFASSGVDSSPGRGHCVVFLCKTLDSHSVSLHQGAQIGTDKFDTRGNPAMD